MTGVQKGVVLGVWVATVLVAYAAGRLAPPPEPASVPDDFGAAIRAALAEKDALDRVERTASVLQQLGPENVAEVAAVYDGMITLLGELEIRPFTATWARFDPAAALDHALNWSSPEKRKFGAGGAIEGWALHDPAGALRAYQEAEADYSNLSDDLFLDMLTGWAYSGDEGLVEYLEGLSQTRQELGVARVAVRLMRSGGVETTMDWVNAIIRNEAYEMKLRRRVFRRGVRIVGRYDPERAAAWASEHAGQGYAWDIARIVATNWGPKDGAAAMQWVRDHPTEERRDLAVREAFRTWLGSDRKGAVAWLESETLTEFHEPAIDFYAKDLRDDAPEEAVGWCERIVDSATQLSCLKLAAQKWYQRDAVAAETWLQQSPLDEETRRFARTPPEVIREQKRYGRPGVRP